MKVDLMFATVDELKKNAIPFNMSLSVPFVTVPVKIGHLSVEPYWAPTKEVLMRNQKTYRYISNTPEQGMIAFIEGDSLFLLPEMTNIKDVLVKNGFIEGDFCVPIKPETRFCNRVLERKWQRMWLLKKLSMLTE